MCDKRTTYTSDFTYTCPFRGFPRIMLFSTGAPPRHDQIMHTTCHALARVIIGLFTPCNTLTFHSFLKRAEKANGFNVS